MEAEQLSEENASLKSDLDEAPDSVTNRLQEGIHSLGKIKEDNAQQLRANNEEIALLRSRLGAEGGEPHADLLEQIGRYVNENEKKNKLIETLQSEALEIKTKLAPMSVRWPDLERRIPERGCSSDRQASTSSELQHQLTDALEKNQQREKYAMVILDRMLGLEHHLKQASQACSNKHNEGLSEERKDIYQMHKLYNKLLEVQREQADLNDMQQAINDMHRRYEKKQRETGELLRNSAQEQRRSGDRESSLRANIQDLKGRLDREKLRSAEFLLLLQKSSRELECSKKDCLYLEKQLRKVRVELRTTEDYMAKLSERQQHASNSELGDEARVDVPPPFLSNISKLDTSFLQCPFCGLQCPVSQSRELMTHLDHCGN